jgi:hypothetical protein
MLQVLTSLEAVLIQTVYNTKMASVGLSDITMDTTVTHATSHGRAYTVEECRWGPVRVGNPGTLARVQEKQQGSAVPAATLGPVLQVPHWVFWLVLREL